MASVEALPVGFVVVAGLMDDLKIVVAASISFDPGFEEFV